jgi:hypothetical protein
VTALPARRTGRPPSTVNVQTASGRLLDVVRALSAKGVEGTSVQDVVVAAGCSIRSGGTKRPGGT